MSGVLGTWITRQLVFDGIVSGLVYGLLATGIVLVYRSTRVINFAVGNMGMVGAGLFVLMTAQYSVPFWLAAAVSLAVGVVFGAVVELVVVRRLFTAPRVTVLVATIGVAQLSLALLFALPDIDSPGARFPVPIGSVREIAGIRITGPQLTILLVVPVLAGSLGWLLNRTTFGRSVKASADNPDLARLSGISPKLVSTSVWAIAGGLATVAISLVAGQAGSPANLDALGPSTLTRALAAAVIAGMASFPLALLAGIAIGVVQSVVLFNFLDTAGLSDFLLLLLVLVAVRRNAGAEREAATFGSAQRSRAIPERLRAIWWVRLLDRAGMIGLGLGALVLPFVVTQPSRHLLYTTILVFALCGLSLTVLTGWAGQLSLGQMAFAGIGAFLAANLQRGITMDVGWGGTRLIDAGIEPLPFELAVLLAVIATACVAAVVGAGALRVRGLFLAVSTFAFGLTASAFFYDRPILNGGYDGTAPFPRTDVFGVDLSTQRAHYLFVLLLLALLLAVVARLRRTGVGRTTIAVRDNADAAAGYTVDGARTQLKAFAFSGGIAALGGVMLASAVQAVPTDRFFTVDESLQLVAIVVIGGLASVSGPVLGALWVIGIPAFFPENDLVPLLTSGVGLLVLLLYFPGGLVQVAYAARDALLHRVERHIGPDPEVGRNGGMPRSLLHPGRASFAAGRPALRAEEVVVAFGGNVAVGGVTLSVGQDEIVGLIGTNGAGKSTLMNAIGGYVPSSGRVELLGSDVSSMTAARRARQGLGRTFQSATLFSALTVAETVAVALEGRGRTGMVSAALCLPPSLRLERRRRSEAADIIDFLGLGRYAEVRIAELSTGTRRIVELAGLLALGARVLCLDEPTAGVAQRESEAFGPLIIEIRRELGASILVIEHDMPLIMGISDRIYCMEAGLVIAEGAPAEVRNAPAVIASYLGTDERAIARSGAAPAT